MKDIEPSETRTSTSAQAPHTPGPWEVAQGEGGQIISSLGGPYCQVIFFDGRKYIYQSPGDARLIAAAPEMLAALKAIRDWLLDTEIIKEKDAQFWRSDFVKANNLAQAAIAKAEGK